MRPTQGGITSWTHRSMDFDEKYEWGSLLGQGSVGIVREIIDKQSKQRMACKTVPQDAPSRYKQTLVSEVALLLKLRHHGISPIYDMGQLNDGRPFYTTRLIDGETFEAFLAKEPSKIHRKQGINILKQVAETLSYAHKEGVIHCDLKPANIMLNKAQEATIIDWGTSESHVEKERKEKQGKTEGYKINGTPLYMSPEVLQGQEAGPQSDQYALGVMLYELLTQSYPFYEQNIYMLFHQVCYTKAQLPSQKRPEQAIPHKLEQICMKLLEKTPEKRYNSCSEVAKALQEWLEEEEAPAKTKQTFFAKVLPVRLSQVAKKPNDQQRPKWFAAPAWQTFFLVSSDGKH